MSELILYFIDQSIVLLSIILMSLYFSGIKKPKKILVSVLSLFIVCGIIQALFAVFIDLETATKLAPVISHVPIFLFICIFLKKNIVPTFATITTAYMFCQPSRWVGIFIYSLTKNLYAEYISEYIVIIITCGVMVKYFSDIISGIFSQSQRDIIIFAIVPIIYYVFDYSINVYTDFWFTHPKITIEFMPLFISAIYTAFCIVYYKEYREKLEIESKEQIVKLTAIQQQKEIEAIHRNEYETRILRHDMRHFLNNIGTYIDKGDLDSAKKVISNITEIINNMTIKKYCNNTTINYIVSGIEAKCNENEIKFIPNISIENLNVDETLFTAILANALDNAVNAQLSVPKEQRQIDLLLQTKSNKIILSVKNPYVQKPLFENGKLISRKEGHGVGTQSIKHISEKLGGHCQFTVTDKDFIVRVII